MTRPCCGWWRYPNAQVAQRWAYGSVRGDQGGGGQVDTWQQIHDDLAARDGDTTAGETAGGRNQAERTTDDALTIDIDEAPFDGVQRGESSPVMSR